VTIVLWSGISVGALYALTAMAFNIVFISTATFNFAQPQYLMLGTLAGYVLIVEAHLATWMAIVISLLVGALVGVVEELVAVRYVAGKGVHGELVTTVGWSTAMVGVVLLVWGAAPREVPAVGGTQSVAFLGGRLLVSELIIIALAVALPVGLSVWSRNSRFGLMSLAASEDRVAATVRGINVKMLSTASYAMAGAVLAAVGVIAAGTTYAVYSVGSAIVLQSFVALAIGGFGSYIGAIIGGLGVGVLQGIVTYYLGTQYVNSIILIVLLLTLLLRPQGLFGAKVEREV
jgi:branched-chain amino acid transport system permease protein